MRSVVAGAAVDVCRPRTSFQLVCTSNVLLVLICSFSELTLWSSEVGIYKRKQESKKTRKQEIDQESDHENKKKRKHAFDKESDQEKKKKKENTLSTKKATKK